MSEDIEGFQWDKSNSGKSWRRHKVADLEAEEIFFHEPILIFEDTAHSETENRYYCLGQTDQARGLFAVFTLRENKIRIISARDMNRKEKAIYEKQTQKNPIVSE